jgi:hypothetical protein
MSAKTDVKLGLYAEIRASRQEVVDACLRAVAVMGKRAEATAANAKVTVKIFPGVIRAISEVSPLVGINLKPGADGRVVVEVRIERYRTTSAIIGPKVLDGKSAYKNLLTSLEQELEAIGDGSGVIRRTGV